MNTYTQENATPTALAINPFPGLRPFEFDESHLFFGRDGQSERLIAKLAATRFLAVVGTSGSGKSSLVRAGLLPALYSGFMPGAGSAWRIAVMRPGNDPLGNLARALNAPDVFGSEDEENRALQIAITETTLRRSKLGLVEAAREQLLPATENLLVVADQFEELFRVEQSNKDSELENDRAAFVKLLLAARAQREMNIYVVLTMRSDYLGDCAQFWDLPEAINDGQYLIPRLTREQIREAITGPIFVGGAEATPRLINRLLNDVGDNPDQLSILQHALMRIWYERRDQRLTVAENDQTSLHAEVHQGAALDLCCYEAVGTMARALSLHANEALYQLPDNRHRLVAERVFKALTEKGPDNREIRRPVTLGALCLIADATDAEVKEVIETFRAPSRSFLMPPAGTELTAESLIDISHESLMRNWQQLKNWVEDEAESAHIYRRLSETAALYPKKAGLWRDPDLQVALDWQREKQPNPDWAARYNTGYDAAIAFLEKSAAQREADLAAAERQQREETERTQRELAVAQALAETEKRRAEEQTQAGGKLRRRARAVGGLAMLAFLVAGYAVWQTQQANAGEKRQRQLFYVANIQLAQKAFEEGYVGRGHELLRIIGQNAGTSSAEDMRSFFWYYLWRNCSELGIVQGRLGAVYSVAFSIDGKMLATSNDDKTVRLWDVMSQQLLATLKGHNDAVLSVAFSGDGRTLATGSDDQTVRLWDVASRQEIAPALNGHTKAVSKVVFSPDGKTLATSSNDQTVRLWDVASRQELATLTGHKGAVYSVAFSPDGKTLATGGADKTVKLWDTMSHQIVATLTGHKGGVSSVAFSPDGRLLATGSADKTVKLWMVTNLQELAFPAQDHTSDVYSVAFSPDGKTLATGSGDQSIRIWDITNRQELAKLKGHKDSVLSVAFSPDGRTLATGSGREDQTARLWDVTGRRELEKLIDDTRALNSVAISSDGRTLATGSDDQTVRLWNMINHQMVATLKGHKGTVYSVVFSPDGRTLATGSDDQTVKLWDVASHQELATLTGHKGAVYSVVFSPDGRALVTGSDDQTVKLWDVASHQELATLTGHKGTIRSVTFSIDGKMLASAGSEQTVKLWDVASHQELATLTDHKGVVYSVAFSPDGRTLATGSDDQTVKLWDVASHQELVPALKGHKDTVYSVAFSPDGKTLATGSRDRAVKLWDMASQQELASLNGHTNSVQSVAFASDGRTLASASADTTIRLWRGASDAEVARDCTRCGRKD